MSRRSDVRAGVAVALALALALASVPGCSSPKSNAVEVEIGHHRVRLVVPEGWERLDHGRQQLFRDAEAQISLVDLGPATRDAMVSELRAAQTLWLAGRRKDAFQKIRSLRSPSLRFAPSEQRADFWKPWTDVTYIPDAADSGAIGPALEALIEGTAMFEPVTPERMVMYVLMIGADVRRREVGQKEQRTIHGAEWTVVEIWDRVSHLDRARVAFLVNNGYLLVLGIDRGVFEQTGKDFDALLSSIEVAPDTSAGAPTP